MPGPQARCHDVEIVRELVAEQPAFLLDPVEDEAAYDEWHRQAEQADDARDERGQEPHEEERQDERADHQLYRGNLDVGEL